MSPLGGRRTAAAVRIAGPRDAGRAVPSPVAGIKRRPCFPDTGSEQLSTDTYGLLEAVHIPQGGATYDRRLTRLRLSSFDLGILHAALGVSECGHGKPATLCGQDKDAKLDMRRNEEEQHVCQ